MEFLYIFLGIIATIAGGIGLKIVENIINRHGVIDIFCRIQKIQERLVIMRFEVKNLTNSEYFIRNLALSEVDESGNIVNESIQVSKIGDETRVGDNLISKESECLGNNENYTFVIT